LSTPKASLFYVHVEFNKDHVTVDEDKITVGVRSKPVDGEANKEVVKKIARHFGVPSSKVAIRSGHRSRDKIIQITDLKS
jgi:uncharacterized protein (TIGR00251 family)